MHPIFIWYTNYICYTDRLLKFYVVLYINASLSCVLSPGQTSNFSLTGFLSSLFSRVHNKQVFDQYFRDHAVYYEAAGCRHVQILHVYLLYRPEDESNFNICTASSNQSISLSIFPGRPYTRTVFLVQKLTWPAFEPGSLPRKTCKFFAIHTSN